MADEALVVQDLRKSYRNREVVKGVSFSAHFGEITAVLGPNGAGKTTTIECCEGLRVPDSGHISILGHRPHSAPPQIRNQWGVMLQDGGLPLAVPAGNVLKHITRLTSNNAKTRYRELVDHLQLSDFLATPVRRLSGGQRQRLGLACALASNPRVLFLDEPTAGMDIHARRDVHTTITSARELGAAIILTTHLLDEAETLSDRIVLMSQGNVAIDAKTADLPRFNRGGLDLTLTRPVTIATMQRFLPSAPDGSSVQPHGDSPPNARAHRRWRITPTLNPRDFAHLTSRLADEDISISKLNTASDLTDLFLQVADDAAQMTEHTQIS